MTPKKDAKKKRSGKGIKNKTTPAVLSQDPVTPTLEFSPVVYRVMWDWERDDFEGVFRPNLPSVFRCGEISDPSNGHYVDLTREWQFFWFDLCSKICFGRYHQELKPKEYKWLADKWSVLGATKTAFTNQKGVNDFANYVTNDRVGEEDPKIYTLVCGGATLTGTPVLFKKGIKRAWMLKVDHFDGTQDPPPVETIDPYTDPRVFFATTITKRKVKGRYQIPVVAEKSNPPGWKFREIKEGYRVNPFPQFKKEGRLLDCPVPLVARKDIYFPLKDLVPINDGVKARPYYP